MIELTLQGIVDALALKMSTALPGVAVYANPRQQQTRVPAMFITFMESAINKKMNSRFQRDIGIDLAYLEELNLPDLTDRYLAAAEALDCALETIDYQGANLRTYERKWFIELDALHYQLKLRARVAAGEDQTSMKELGSLREELK